MNIAELLSINGIKNVVTVPDSLNGRMIKQEELNANGIKYIQVLNEISAVALSSGLNLVGDYSVCVIENSGIRYACDTIARFEMSHGIHNMYIISNRGDFGERNWWGVFHTEITADILKRCRMRIYGINTVDELKDGLKKSLNTFFSEQVSTVLVMNYSIYEGML